RSAIIASKADASRPNGADIIGSANDRARISPAAEEVAEPTTPPKNGLPNTVKISQRDQLMTVANRSVFWTSTEGTAHATMNVDGHIEHHAIRSSGFRNRLLLIAGVEFPVVVGGRKQAGGFSKNSIEEALTLCESSAMHSAKICDERLRVAE